MSGFKAQRTLLGNDTDDEDEEEEQGFGQDANGDEGDEFEEEEGEPEMSSSDRKAKRREAEWLAANFIRRTKAATGEPIYKSLMITDKVFFSKEKLDEYLKGKRHKRLLKEMKKGLRTHADNEKLRLKASARRERSHAKRSQRRTDRVREKRKAGAANVDDIERMKQRFQEKKARRLARRAAADIGDEAT